MTTPPDHNKECWTAFCPSEEVAEKELRKVVNKLSEAKLIVSAKKEMIGKPGHTLHGLQPYRFTIITTPKS